MPLGFNSTRPPLLNVEPLRIGQAIHQRIAVRERAILQSEFLSRFFASPESSGFVLCGSLALHGAYLQGRWSKDLDFEAPAPLAARFLEIAHRCSLPLRARETPSSIPNVVSRVYAKPGRAYAEVQIGVEVFPHSKPISFERHTIHLSERHSVPNIAVKPLVQIIGSKIGCLEKRRQATDFLDLWLGLRDPTVREAARLMLINGDCSAGLFTPSTVQATFHLTSLMELRPVWASELGAVMKTPPTFDCVYDDLARWLPTLEPL